MSQTEVMRWSFVSSVINRWSPEQQKWSSLLSYGSMPYVDSFLRRREFFLQSFAYKRPYWGNFLWQNTYWDLVSLRFFHSLSSPTVWGSEGGSPGIITGWERWMVSKSWQTDESRCHNVWSQTSWKGVCIYLKGDKLRLETHSPWFLPGAPKTSDKWHTGLQLTSWTCCTWWSSSKYIPSAKSPKSPPFATASIPSRNSNAKCCDLPLSVIEKY